MLSTAPSGAERVPVTVDALFSPSTVRLKVGRAAVLVFTRTTDKTCAKSVEIPSLNVKEALPLGKPVEVALTPTSPGTISFECGMHMLQGSIVVE